MALVSSSNFIDNCISNLEEKVLNDDLSLRALAASLAVFLPPKFRGPCPAICAFLAHLWELKAGAGSGAQNCASESKIYQFRPPFLIPFLAPAKLKKVGQKPARNFGCMSKYDIQNYEQLLPTGRRNFLLCNCCILQKLSSAGCQRQNLLGRQHGKFPVAQCVPIWCLRLIPS